MSAMEIIRSDFDRLAAFDSGGWNHNDYYHPYLLRHLPVTCEESLDIGCGTGTFARLLATRSQRVLAVDLSPEMIRIAQQRSADFPNIVYRVVDVLQWPFPVERFDCIASIATMHHLPLEEALAKMKAALMPGGVLLILDLFKAKTLTDFLLSIIAFPTNILMQLWKNGRPNSSVEERRAWQEHGRHDRYFHIPSVRHACADLLPGAILKRHLFWRYSIVWPKPIQNKGSQSL